MFGRKQQITVESDFGKHYFKCTCGAHSRPCLSRDEAEAKGQWHAKEHKNVTVRR
ncbi:hypothetical protein [Streptomyces sp. AA1529]|uniref:hypothetical protein n=1 Tax=unclassified Streptomyces TaxID=2593676 RepID=UPI0003103652|nr:hypothetical protein [Streptomyces sp. AA1529]